VPGADLGMRTPTTIGHPLTDTALTESADTVTTSAAALDDRWADAAAPTTAQAWLDRAREVSDILIVDAVDRDRANLAPHAEVRPLKASGLVTLLGPVASGGGGQTWETAYQVIRIIPRGDGSIGQLLGDHYLRAWAARLVATDEQIAAIEDLYTTNNFLFGGAVNPRDSDLIVVEEGDELVVTGRKSFSTGGQVADLTVLEGMLAGTVTHIFAIVPTDQPGIRFGGDWDNLGQRLTESGSVEIQGVRVPWAAAAGFVEKVFQPLIYNTLNVPAIQLVFTNFYLGITQGALETASAYTRTATRAWPYGDGDRNAPPTSGTCWRGTASCSPSSGPMRPWPTGPAPRSARCCTRGATTSRPAAAARSRC
jgi:alkylation response protein AidB-like acyl-CoA dehydrogenase